MGCALVVCLLVALAASECAAEMTSGHRHRHFNPREHAQHHVVPVTQHERDIQYLAQEDEAADTPAPQPRAQPPADLAPKADVASTSSTGNASLLSCSNVNGQIICLPANNGQNTQAAFTAPLPVPSPPEAPSVSTHAEVPAETQALIADLKKQLADETMSKNTAVEMAKGMVDEVREETKKMVEDARQTARDEHAENEALRKQIVQLEEQIQNMSSEPSATPAPSADIQSAVSEYENLRKQYESLL